MISSNICNINNINNNKGNINKNGSFTASTHELFATEMTGQLLFCVRVCDCDQISFALIIVT